MRGLQIKGFGHLSPLSGLADLSRDMAIAAAANLPGRCGAERAD
jgi:hypothetical protein